MEQGYNFKRNTILEIKPNQCQIPAKRASTAAKKEKTPSYMTEIARESERFSTARGRDGGGNRTVDAWCGGCPRVGERGMYSNYIPSTTPRPDSSGTKSNKMSWGGKH